MSPVCFVTEVLSTLMGSAPRARKGCPQASALRLCSPSLRFALRVGDPPPLALATPAVRHEPFGMCIHAEPHQNTQTSKPTIPQLSTWRNALTTTAPTIVLSTLVQLVDALHKQAAAVHAISLKEIAAMGPRDPDDREEFEILRTFLAENRQKIDGLFAEQKEIIDSLLEIGQDAPQAA
jgi:hypothetical protein